MDQEDGDSAHWQRNLWVCVFGSFTTIVAMTLLLPFLPLYVEQLGVSDHAAIVQWSGVAYGAAFFTAALFAPLWGRLADLYGRKLMLIRASLGMAVAMSLIGLSQNVYQLGGVAAAGGAVGRVFVRIDRAGGDGDAQGPDRLGVGDAVDGGDGGESDGAVDRGISAAADRHPGDLPGGGRDHFRCVSGDNVPDQGEAEAKRERSGSSAGGGRAFRTSGRSLRCWRRGCC